MLVHGNNLRELPVFFNPFIEDGLACLYLFVHVVETERYLLKGGFTGPFIKMCTLCKFIFNLNKNIFGSFLVLYLSKCWLFWE